MRPEPPLMQRVWSQQLVDILHACWQREPAQRLPFTEIDRQVQQLRAKYGADLKESPYPRQSEVEQMMKKRKSPDMHPIPLPLLPREYTLFSGGLRCANANADCIALSGNVGRDRLCAVDGCLIYDCVLSLGPRSRTPAI